MAMIEPYLAATGDLVTSTIWNGTWAPWLRFLYGDTDGWTEVAAGSFENGWTGWAWYKARGLLVALQGVVSGGTLGAPAFALPVEYQPEQLKRFPCVANGAAGMFSVGSDVTPTTGSTSSVSLEASWLTAAPGLVAWSTSSKWTLGASVLGVDTVLG